MSQSELSTSTSAGQPRVVPDSTHESPVRERKRPVLWALGRLQQVAPKQTNKVSHLVVRAGYGLVNRQMRQLPRSCVNYGWAALDDTTPPGPNDPDRLGIALYRQVLAGADITGKSVLEVGCGRGGGTAFLCRDAGAAKVVGIDLTPSSIATCQRLWQMPGLRFQVGDAEELPLADGLVDAVVNVESSHNYRNIERFLSESFRVLRPGGNLFLADMRPTEHMPTLRAQIADAGFEVVDEKDITANVVHSLTLDAASRREWVEGNFPKFLRGAAAEFAGASGTKIFEALESRVWQYHTFVGHKP